MTIDEMIKVLDKIRKNKENEEIQYQLSSIGIFLAKVKDLIAYVQIDKKTEWNPDCEGCNPEDPGECQLCRER